MTMDEKTGITVSRTIQVELTDKRCPLNVRYAERHAAIPPKITLVCCEGACLRGEIARRAANLIAHEIAPEKTVRICMGSLLERGGGMRKLVEKAGRVLAIEGCFLSCSSRITRGALRGSKPEIIITDKLYNFNRRLFGINEITEKEMGAHARVVAEKVVEGYIG